MARTSRRHGAAAAVALALCIGLATPAVAADTDDALPVPLTFVPAILGALPNHLGGDAPGSNDWDCEPTTDRPRPVVLVHGTVGNQSTNWQTFSPALANEGYCVFALTYGLNALDPGLAGGTGARMEESAEELRDFVDDVLASTGADAVDIIGHSQGSLMPNYYVKFLGGHEVVQNYIGLTPLWNGTALADGLRLGDPLGLDSVELTPLCQACVQFARNSDFIAEMREGGVAVDGVNYLNLMTRYDQLVIPHTSGADPDMENVVVQDVCPTDLSDHLAIAASPTALDLALRHLDPTDERPVRCTLTLPALGVGGLGLVLDPLQGLSDGRLRTNARSLADEVGALAGAAD